MRQQVFGTGQKKKDGLFEPLNFLIIKRDLIAANASLHPNLSVFLDGFL